MKKFLPIILSSLLLLSSNPLLAQSAWTPIATAVAKSIVYIENSHGSCTGFVINDKGRYKDEDVDYVLTAAHCEGVNLFVDQQPAEIVSKDTKKDLLVLRVKDLNRPALHLAKDDPKIGDEIASYGYGYGLERPIFRITHISDDKTYIPYQGIGGPLLAVDTTFVPGQSGGPVVNLAGEVVMIVQLGTESVGLGVGAETIDDKVGKFFGAAK